MFDLVSIGDARELLFIVQGRRFTAPWVKIFLGAHDLTFVGLGEAALRNRLVKICQRFPMSLLRRLDRLGQGGRPVVAASRQIEMQAKRIGGDSKLRVQTAVGQAICCRPATHFFLTMTGSAPKRHKVHVRPEFGAWTNTATTISLTRISCDFRALSSAVI